MHKDDVPLTRTAESSEEVLYWVFLGCVWVHPDRWERFLAEFERAGVKLEPHPAGAG